MSIATQIASIESSRNTIRNKLVELGMAQSSDKLEKLAGAVGGITNQGAVSATVKEGDTYTFNFDLVTDYSHITHSLGTATVYSFDPNLLPDYPLAEEFRHPILREVSDIRNPLTECVHIFSEKRSCYRERASALLKLCLLELLSQSKEGERSELCEKVLTAVRENYADPTLTNESIAKDLNYHPYHINRVVKKETGYALRTYIIEYRLSMAKNLLLTTKDTISRVAEACGFASTSYFTKLFKEKNRIPPKEYRKSRIHSEI